MKNVLRLVSITFLSIQVYSLPVGDTNEEANNFVISDNMDFLDLYSNTDLFALCALPQGNLFEQQTNTFSTVSTASHIERSSLQNQSEATTSAAGHLQNMNSISSSPVGVTVHENPHDNLSSPRHPPVSETKNKKYFEVDYTEKTLKELDELFFGADKIPTIDIFWSINVRKLCRDMEKLSRKIYFRKQEFDEYWATEGINNIQKIRLQPCRATSIDGEKKWSAYRFFPARNCKLMVGNEKVRKKVWEQVPEVDAIAETSSNQESPSKKVKYSENPETSHSDDRKNLDIDRYSIYIFGIINKNDNSVTKIVSLLCDEISTGVPCLINATFSVEDLFAKYKRSQLIVKN